jgi:hypothetical protein
MNFWRGRSGGNIAGEETAADTGADIDPGGGEIPGPEVLFARANQIRAQKGLDATTDSSVGAQVVLTSLAMEVLRVADRELHPNAMDARQAALAWAYVCCMSAPIIAIVDKQDDFDHQAFVLAVASAVLQFFDSRSLVQIIQDGTILFHDIVTEGEQSQAFLNFNDQVHELVLAYVADGAGDACEALRDRYAAFGKLIS